MVSIFDSLRKVQKEVKELEQEYNEKYRELQERKEKIRQNEIYDDLEAFYMYRGNLDSDLGIVTTSDNYDRSRAFFEEFSFLWKYLENANNLIEPTDENIYSLGQYIFSDPNNLFSKEELEKVRCGKTYLNDHSEVLEHHFYASSWEHPVYKIAAICLRLENLGFRTAYELEKECVCRLVNIEVLKKQIRDYKIEIGETIVKGSANKVEQTVNQVVLPTIDNVVKPSISKGIKLLAKKFNDLTDNNQE